jgi:uncharacterized RDD family membrane protein YckC
MRFDEVELETVPPLESPVVAESSESGAAPLHKRVLALLTDLSLFAALALALSPLLPPSANWIAVASLGGFILVFSYYYFAGGWLLWGKTVGAAIFDIRVVAGDEQAMSLKAATLRWAGTLLSIVTGGLGFLFSLPNRMSSTRCVRLRS